MPLSLLLHYAHRCVADENILFLTAKTVKLRLSFRKGHSSERDFSTYSYLSNGDRRVYRQLYSSQLSLRRERQDDE